MIGYSKRDATSFTDGLGRIFEWNFVPKDMSFVKWSLYHTLKLGPETCKVQ